MHFNKDLTHYYNILYQSMNRCNKQQLRQGYTIIELAVVIAGLSILAAISLPAILDIIITQPRIDEAKSLLNSAIAECLQRQRTYPNNWQEWQPEVLKSRSLPTGYEYVNSKNTCSEIEIKDLVGGDSSKLPVLKFSIINGRAVKESAFFHPDAEAACESWGNCGGSPSAAYLKTCFQSKQTCDNNLSKALLTGVDRPLGFTAWNGQCIWPADTSCGCNREVWSCNGIAYFSQTEFENCRRAKSTAACNAHRQSLSASSGAMYDPAGTCPDESWWVNGSQVDRCDYEYERWKLNNIEGAFNANGCTKTGYKCTVPNVGRKVFENTSTKPSDCDPPSPAPDPDPTPKPSQCGDPPKSWCPSFPTKSVCQEWARCMNLI